ncbi:hypothetical protein SUNI508_04740 [Seiridium unicorne]|uniref:Uncharacterized protein n=1 Tax=Seiridium unicorne TaxID=138068 RepID=A0ABR2V739_9PEZI
MPEGRQSRARGHLNIRLYKSAYDGLINQLRITLEYKSTAGRDLEALQPMRSPLRLERELWSPIFANLVHCELVVGRNLPNRLMYWSQTQWKKLVFLDKRPLVALWEALDPFLPAHIEVQIIDNDTKLWARNLR